jgi:hypothetical protein
MSGKEQISDPVTGYLSLRLAALKILQNHSRPAPGREIQLAIARESLPSASIPLRLSLRRE